MTVKHFTHDILSIFKIELGRIFTDRGVLLLFIGASIFYPLVYSLVYSGEVVRDVSVAVIDNDNSKSSRKLSQLLDATPEVMVAYKCQDLSQAQTLFYEHKIDGIVLIENDFQKNILQSKQGVITVYSDAGYMLNYKQVATATQAVAGNMGAAVAIQRMMAKGVPRENAIVEAKIIDYQAQPLYNPSGGYGSYLMPALLVLVLQQTLLMGIGMLGGTDKEKGSYDFLFPFAEKKAGALRILLGKAMAYFTVYILIAFYLFVVVMKMFHFPHQAEFMDIVRISVPYILAVIFMGLLLSTFFKTRENSMMFLLFTSIPLLFLSGFSWPLELIPEPLIVFSQIFPSTHAIKIFHKTVVMGIPLHEILFSLFVIWVIAFAFFALAWVRFAWVLKKLKE